MSTRNFVLGSAFLLPLLTATPAAAQRVSADIRIGGGPISGRVIVGDRYDYRPRRVGRVQWVRVHDRGFDRGWFGKFRREARVIVVYYDPRDDRYYDRYRDGWDQVRLYDYGGRFYRIDDDRYFDRYDSRDWDDRYDRRNDQWDRRNRDDRRDDRYDRRDDRNDRRDDRYDRNRSRDDRRDGRRDPRRDNWRGDRGN